MSTKNQLQQSQDKESKAKQAKGKAKEKRKRSRFLRKMEKVGSRNYNSPRPFGLSAN